MDAAPKRDIGECLHAIKLSDTGPYWPCLIFSSIKELHTMRQHYDIIPKSKKIAYLSLITRATNQYGVAFRSWRAAVLLQKDTPCIVHFEIPGDDFQLQDYCEFVETIEGEPSAELKQALQQAANFLTRGEEVGATSSAASESTTPTDSKKRPSRKQTAKEVTKSTGSPSAKAVARSTRSGVKQSPAKAPPRATVGVKTPPVKAVVRSTRSGAKYPPAQAVARPTRNGAKTPPAKAVVKPTRNDAKQSPSKAVARSTRSEVKTPPAVAVVRSTRSEVKTPPAVAVVRTTRSEVKTPPAEPVVRSTRSGAKQSPAKAAARPTRNQVKTPPGKAVVGSNVKSEKETPKKAVKKVEQSVSHKRVSFESQPAIIKQQSQVKQANAKKKTPTHSTSVEKSPQPHVASHLALRRSPGKNITVIRLQVRTRAFSTVPQNSAFAFVQSQLQFEHMDFSFQEVKPLFVKGGYTFPHHRSLQLPNDNGQPTTTTFNSEKEFREHLCRYGVQCKCAGRKSVCNESSYRTTEPACTCWDAVEQIKIHCYVRFHILHDSEYRRHVIHANDISPTEFDALLQQLGFRIEGAKFYYAPRVDVDSFDGRKDLLQTMARNGWPEGCDFTKISDVQRFDMEYYIAMYYRNDTFALQSDQTGRRRSRHAS